MLKDIHSYSNPSREHENDLVILHCGTNDLRGTKQAKQVADGIIELAKDLKTTNNEVMISSILPRRDNLNNKGKEVNNFLSVWCRQNKYHFIEHTNIDANKHMNYNGLHLNYQGTNILGCNLEAAIKI